MRAALLCVLIFLHGHAVANEAPGAVASGHAMDEGMERAMDQAIGQITVTAGLRDDADVRRLPSGISVLDRETLASTAFQHVEEVVPLVPNLNWSGDGSRARYFQVRGAGELEQYEGAPNASVGFIIDDIDFSGIGGIATRFDLDQVEVLRGPQGTRYGANALAGLIYARSADPGETFASRAETTLGSDGAWSIGAAAGGPVTGLGPGVSEQLSYRVSVQQYGSEGFRNNDYLGSDDTSQRDEFTARSKLRWQMDSGWQADLALLFVNLDNGYDAWTLDNSFTTRSDKPGEDSQETVAGSLRLTGALNDAVELVSITGIADSDIRYSFDSDWGNPQLWAPDVYDFTQGTDRRRQTINQELRLVSTPAGRIGGRVDWLAGVYSLYLDESNRVHDLGLLDLDDAACPPPPDPAADFCLPFGTDRTISSDYEAQSLAMFGELSALLDQATRLALGLRGEVRHAEYADRLDDAIFAATAQNAFDPTDRMWGGELTLTRDLAPEATAWARMARGYKAGGFNPSLARVDFSASDLNVSPEQVEFEPEALWNYEIGLRLAGEASWLSASAFWQDREDMQVRVPIQLSPGDPNTFVFLTDNAQSADALGLEAEFGWQLTEALLLTGALGLLDTELKEFDAGPAFDGHDFPHAPPYTFALAAEWAGPAGWFARADVTGRGEFYFDYDSSTGDDRKADASRLVGLRAGRRAGAWEIAGWVRNLFDEDYAVRGFYFGNEPPDFAPARYIRPGDPRQVGVTVTWRM